MGSEVKKEAGLPPCPPRSAQAKLRWRLLSRAIVPSRQGAEDVYARANLRSGNDFDATNSSENSSKNISKNINKKSVILQFVTYQKESRSNTRDDDFCVICQSNFEEPEYLVKLACTHKLHEYCGLRWLFVYTKYYCAICKGGMKE